MSAVSIPLLAPTRRMARVAALSTIVFHTERRVTSFFARALHAR
jgi:hypothetical protein